MDVRVAAEIAFGVHVTPSLEPQRELALSRLNLHGGSQRCVFKAAGDINNHLAAR